MAKNIVLCLDGTGNQLRAKRNTNVIRLYDLLSHDEPSGQATYYDPGVGTFGAQGALLPISYGLSRLAGLAFGYGVRTNLADGYAYLMKTYEPGDRIFIFGFSRGAYTARALAGLLNRAGLLRQGAENLIPYAVRVYARADRDWKSEHFHEAAKFAKTFSMLVDGKRAVPIHFLGLWDSVKAAGILRGSMTWPDTRQLPNVAHIRHAVSIDEKRRPYREYLVHPKASPPDVREVWFAGVHSDIGGTFEDDDPRLADVTLKWMVRHATQLDLILAPDAAAKLPDVTAESALGKLHQMGWAWALLTYRRRLISPSTARVHASVKARMADGRYMPKLPEGFVWDDPQWPGGPETESAGARRT